MDGGGIEAASWWLNGRRSAGSAVTLRLVAWTAQRNKKIQGITDNSIRESAPESARLSYLGDASHLGRPLVRRMAVVMESIFGDPARKRDCLKSISPLLPHWGNNFAPLLRKMRRRVKRSAKVIAP